MTSSNNKKNTQANDFEDISEIIKALNISTDDFAIRTTRFWKINFAPGRLFLSLTSGTHIYFDTETALGKEKFDK
ncbi:hypothetical protein YC2023_100402 [Brassica napus]